MHKGFAKIPPGQHYWLNQATLPQCLLTTASLQADTEGLCRGALEINAGVISAIAPHAEDNAPHCDLDGALVLPTFVDMHTHLDKGHIWPRQQNIDGRFSTAIDAVYADQDRHWRVEDLRRRMDFSLRSAYAHGTAHLRTHLDAPPELLDVSFPVFADLREAWEDRMTLQAVSLRTIDHFEDDAYLGKLLAVLRTTGAHLGAVTFMSPNLPALLQKIFKAADRYGFDLDFHADETNDPESQSLRCIAETAIALRHQGRVTVGHCCSLAQQSADDIARTLDLVVEAGLSIVSLPMCNMFLQARNPGQTPAWRGITLVHEMQARGIPVAFGSDNTRDPFYAYGDLDGLEVFREAVRIGQLDCPYSRWISAVNAVPARAMGLEGVGMIAPGSPADLVILQGRSYTEILSRPESQRTVLRNGRAIDRQLPDYRELDDLVSLKKEDM